MSPRRAHHVSMTPHSATGAVHPDSAGFTRHAHPAVGDPVLRLSGERLPVVGTGRLYTCGITPYDVTHLGHAATFVWSDLLYSVWRLPRVATGGRRNLPHHHRRLTPGAG